MDVVQSLRLRSWPLQLVLIGGMAWSLTAPAPRQPSSLGEDAYVPSTVKGHSPRVPRSPRQTVLVQRIAPGQPGAKGPSLQTRTGDGPNRPVIAESRRHRPRCRHNVCAHPDPFPTTRLRC